MPKLYNSLQINACSTGATIGYILDFFSCNFNSFLFTSWQQIGTRCNMLMVDGLQINT